MKTTKGHVKRDWRPMTEMCTTPMQALPYNARTTKTEKTAAVREWQKQNNAGNSVIQPDDPSDPRSRPVSYNAASKAVERAGK